jgi:hypothetical protein
VYHRERFTGAEVLKPAIPYVDYASCGLLCSELELCKAFEFISHWRDKDGRTECQLYRMAEWPLVPCSDSDADPIKHNCAFERFGGLKRE